MKKVTIIGPAIAAVLVASSVSMTAFAASNPADDVSSYSYNTGEQSYASRMTESHDWYNTDDEAANEDYSFNAGSQAAQTRDDVFAETPDSDDVTKDQIESYLSENGIGEESAWIDGSYDEASKDGYGYHEGESAYQQRHAVFAESN